MDHTFFLTAGAVVIDAENRILLMQNPRRGWELPGGHLQAGESLTQCVVREAREETGIEVVVLHLRGIVQEVAAGRCNTFWLARPAGGRLTTSAESLDEAPTLIQRPDYREELPACLSAERRPFSLTRA